MRERQSCAAVSRSRSSPSEPPNAVQLRRRDRPPPARTAGRAPPQHSRACQAEPTSSRATVNKDAPRRRGGRGRARRNPKLRASRTRNQAARAGADPGADGSSAGPLAQGHHRRGPRWTSRPRKRARHAPRPWGYGGARPWGLTRAGPRWHAESHGRGARRHCKATHRARAWQTRRIQRRRGRWRPRQWRWSRSWRCPRRHAHARLSDW